MAALRVCGSSAEKHPLDFLLERVKLVGIQRTGGIDGRLAHFVALLCFVGSVFTHEHEPANMNYEGEASLSSSDHQILL